MTISAIARHALIPQARSTSAARESGPVDTVELTGGLKSAFAAVEAFTQQNLGPDFKTHAIYGKDNYFKDGTPNPAGRLQFNVTGHLHGQPDKYSYAKVHQKDEGTTLSSGPWDDKNSYHKLRTYSADELVDFDSLVKTVVNGDFGRKFPPSTDIKVELWYSDRLKQPCTRFAWASDKQGVHWYCDMSFNPFTGQEVERDAAHA